MNDSVTRYRASITKHNGQDIYDWANAVAKTITRVQVVGQSTARVFEDRTLNISERFTLRAKYDADIQAGDRIVWQGNTYEIEGEVFHTKSPTGRVSSTRCTLVRWVG
ncbi:MAG: head-tail adaptor protein [bacterium]|nr:head-tail adaptor protein [bacterium]